MFTTCKGGGGRWSHTNNWDMEGDFGYRLKREWLWYSDHDTVDEEMGSNGKNGTWDGEQRLHQ